MNRSLILIIITFLVIFGGVYGYYSFNKSVVQEVKFEDLASNPQKFNGRNIIVEGFFFQGWEVIVLCERLESSERAENHLVPGGMMIWVEGGMPREVYDLLHKQDTMGPEERFGKVRIQGKYNYGGTYGHLGGFFYQIIPSSVVLLD
jgi:hypothetical protein